MYSPKTRLMLENTDSSARAIGIGYAGFAAPPWRSGGTMWGYVIGGAANYTLNTAGVILVNHMGGTSYTNWLNTR
jgi:hypothetical protein